MFLSSVVLLAFLFPCKLVQRCMSSFLLHFFFFFFLRNFIIHFVKLQVKLLMNTLWKKIKHSSFTTEHVLVCERLLLFLTMQVFVLFPSVWESSKPAEGWRTLVLSIRPVVQLGAAEFCPANQQQETDIKKASLQKYLTFRFPSLSVFFFLGGSFYECSLIKERKLVHTVSRKVKH